MEPGFSRTFFSNDFVMQIGKRLMDTILEVGITASWAI